MQDDSHILMFSTDDDNSGMSCHPSSTEGIPSLSWDLTNVWTNLRTVSKRADARGFNRTSTEAVKQLIFQGTAILSKDKP